MENLLGDVIIDAQKNPVAVASLAELDAVLLYFSAHWCGPCRGFTPQLKKTYQALKADGKKVEIVFVSSDKDQASFDAYFAEMGWTALPFADRERKAKLSAKFKVQGIPTLVVLNGGGELINPDGRDAVSSDPTGKKFPWVPPTLDEDLGDVFVDKQGGTYDRNHLKNKIFGLYFSAHWCPPCRQFTPVLAKVYNQLRAEEKDFEVIFVSGDKDEGQFQEYFHEMPWLAVPYSDKERISRLNQRFEVRGIPRLVLLNGSTGRVIHKNARAVVTKPEEFPWPPKPFHILSPDNASSLNESPALVVFAANEQEQAHAAAAIKGVAEETLAAAEAKGEDPPLNFFVAPPGDLTERVRMVMGIGTSTGILDIPSECAYQSPCHAVGDLSDESVRAFVAGYHASALEKLPLTPMR